MLAGRRSVAIVSAETAIGVLGAGLGLVTGGIVGDGAGGVL